MGKWGWGGGVEVVEVGGSGVEVVGGGGSGSRGCRGGGSVVWSRNRMWNRGGGVCVLM